MKKGLKITLITVGSVVSLLVLLSLVAGPIAKQYVVKHSMELCNRQVSIDKIRANIFTGTVKIKHLRLPEQDGKTEFLSFSKLKVNLSLCRLIKKNFYVQHLRLEDFNARVVQNETCFNFSDIIDLYAHQPQKEETSSVWNVELHDISVRNSSSFYEDVNIGSRVGVKNMNIDVSDLYVGFQNSYIKASMNFEKQGSMTTTMTYSIKNGDFDIFSEITDFEIQNIKPYLDNLLNISKLNGSLSSKLFIKGSMRDILNMSISGCVVLRDVKILNAEASPLTSFSKFKAEVERINLKSKTFNFKCLELQDPIFYYDIYDKGSSLTHLLKNSTDYESVDINGTDTVSAKPLPIHYCVNLLTLKNGEIFYKDLALASYPQTYHITNIQVKAEDLKTGAQSPISLTANLSQSGLLQFNATADLMDLRNATANIMMQNIDIVDFTPYSIHYLAYPVEDGLLSFQSDVQIQDGWLESQNSLDVYMPKFGKRDKNIKPAAAKLPMRMALYIITDRKGHANMDLPVKGYINSPEFSFRKLIWKTLTNFMVKVAASPVDFLAKSMGDNTFNKMTFHADSIQLSMEQIHQLNEIARVLSEKEDMILTIEIDCDLTDSIVATSKQNACYEMITKYLETKNISYNRSRKVPVSKENKFGECILNVIFNLEYLDE